MDANFTVFKTGFGRGAADDENQMVRRAAGGAQGLHLFGEKLFQTCRIEQRFGLLIKHRLVRRTAALGDEQKIVLHAVGGHQIDLRRQIGAGVDLVPHVERRGLRVAEIFLGVSFIDPLGDMLLVLHAGPHLLALFGEHGGRAGVLAKRQDALR